MSRPVAELLEQAGLGAAELRCYYADGEPRLFGSMYEGSSVSRR